MDENNDLTDPYYTGEYYVEGGEDDGKGGDDKNDNNNNININITLNVDSEKKKYKRDWKTRRSNQRSNNYKPSSNYKSRRINDNDGWYKNDSYKTPTRKENKSNPYSESKSSSSDSRGTQRNPNVKVSYVPLNPRPTNQDPFASIFSDMLMGGASAKKEEKEENYLAPIEMENKFNEDSNEECDVLPFEVNDLDDLINLAELYDENNPLQFGINMKRLSMVKDTLINIQNIIGMNSVKTMIFDKIITYLQGLGSTDDMNHIVIQAPPGYGKTTISYYISEIFYKLGIIKPPNKSDLMPTEEEALVQDAQRALSLISGMMGGKTQSKKSNKFYHPVTGKEIDFPFVIAKRSDLVGKYVGHTAPLVEKAVKNALGGVLVIDEVYSIGNSHGDSFSEECINTLNQLLSEKAGQFICIIIGYKDDIERNFFINQGLKRRFRMIITIDEYTPQELVMIFNKMIDDSKWKHEIGNDWLVSFVEKNKEKFKFCGGDMEMLLQNCKDSHSKRVLGLHPNQKKILNQEDIEKGYELYNKFKDNKMNDVSDYMVRTIYM